MSVLSDDRLDRVLAVVAHPDDAEIWFGGSVARWVDGGASVTYVVLTDGASGGFDESIPRSDVPLVRRREQTQAAAVLGVSDIRFIGLAEDELRSSGPLHLELVRVLREVRPQRVVTWSPEWNWARFRSCHPNHRTTGTVTLEAIYPDAENPFAHTSLRSEGLEAWRVPEIWLINSPVADTYVDVTETFRRKVEAVAAHESQVGHHDDLEGWLRARIEPNTAAAGLPAGRLAEAFQVVVNG